jgi:hypothetical protein
MTAELAAAIWAVGSAAYLAGGLVRESVEWQMVREAGRIIRSASPSEKKGEGQ